LLEAAILSEKAEAERRRCGDWLIPSCSACRGERQLHVAKSPFDFAWIDAIEKTGRHDWYEPLRRRLHTKT
jgi:hypothetical protein